jgi:type I restriction enzyme S subunit
MPPGGPRKHPDAAAAPASAMAHALYKSWYTSWCLEFDPVRAKADGRISGMGAATAAAFPSGFVDSSLHHIPAAGKIRAIREGVQGRFDGPHANSQDIPPDSIFLGVRNTIGPNRNLARIDHVGEKDGTRWTEKVTPRGRDNVFTYEATLGWFAIIPPWLRCCLRRRTALIAHAASQAGAYLFHWVTSRTFQEFLISRIPPGATVDRMILSDFPDYPGLCPPTEIVHGCEAKASRHEQAVPSGMREALGLTVPCACPAPKTPLR